MNFNPSTLDHNDEEIYSNRKIMASILTIYIAIKLSAIKHSSIDSQ